MKKKVAARGFVPIEPSPHSEEEDRLRIQYGHNVEFRRVVMLFERSVSQVIFTPEQAEETAKYLLSEAEAARGSRTTKVS